MTAQFTREGTLTKTTERAASTWRGRLLAAWHRIRLTVQEMNYASRRVVERQAPWTVDDQWYNR
jgi:hypothetical protein